MNIRYATDTTNMQVWVMHNGARYAWVGADGHVILWDYYGCEYLAAHSEVVDEVRPAIGSTYFLAGPRHREQATRWADEHPRCDRRRGADAMPGSRSTSATTSATSCSKRPASNSASAKR